MFEAKLKTIPAFELQSRTIILSGKYNKFTGINLTLQFFVYGYVTFSDFQAKLNILRMESQIK